MCNQGGRQDFFADLKILPGNADAIAAAKDFANKPVGWLVLTGAVGTGKTRLLNAILSTWRGQSRQALTSAELLELWRAAVERGDLGPVFHGYCIASAFVLDDLGAEKSTEWALERLTMFLDHRYNRALPTAIATNYGRAGMEAVLGPRIADRVFDQGTGLVRVVTLKVESFRKEAHAHH